MKRIFDLVFSFVVLILLFPFLICIWLIAAIDTDSNGLFLQQRVGKSGKLFQILKFRSIHKTNESISVLGSFMRKYKIDEIPQFINVIRGDMSIVGPRPDFEEFYEGLSTEERLVLELKPGLTSWASIKYFNEENYLKSSGNYSSKQRQIFKDKVQLNLKYYHSQSVREDFKIILNTFKCYWQKSS